MVGMALLVVATLLEQRCSRSPDSARPGAGAGGAGARIADEAVTTLLVLALALNALVLFTERREPQILDDDFGR